MKDSRKHLHHTDIYSRSLSAIPVKRGDEYRILSEGRFSEPTISTQEEQSITSHELIRSITQKPNYPTMS